MNKRVLFVLSVGILLALLALVLIFKWQPVYEGKIIVLRTVEVDTTRQEDHPWLRTLDVKFEVLETDESLALAKEILEQPRLEIFEGAEVRNSPINKAVWIPFDSEVKIFERDEDGSVKSGSLHGTLVSLTDEEIEQVKKVGATIKIEYKKLRFTNNRSSFKVTILN